MSDTTTPNVIVPPESVPPVAPVVPPLTPKVEIPKDLLDAAVAAALQPMKENMDRMVEQRDEALKQKAELEQIAHEAQVQSLKDAGKLVEASELALAQANAKAAALEEKNIALTRDRDVSNALLGIKFWTPKAELSAQREITDSLVKNEQGQWVSRTGQSIPEVVAAFIADPANDYLLAAKQNSGPDLGVLTPTTVVTPSSLFDMKHEDVLAGVASGKIQRSGKSVHSK